MYESKIKNLTVRNSALSTSKSVVNFDQSLDSNNITSFVRVFGEIEVKLRETEEERDALIQKLGDTED